MGQAASLTFAIGPATAGAGTPAPVFPNFASLSAAELVGALDFDNDALATIATGYASVGGAYGTAYAATQATAGLQPTRTTVSNKHVARFTSASLQLLDWGAMITGQAAIFAGSYTLVAVVKQVTATSASVLDIALGASSTTTNRSSLLMSGAGSGHIFRAGSTAQDAIDSATLNTNVHVLIGRRLTGTNSPGLLNVDKTGGNFAAPFMTGSAVPDTATLGARKSVSGTTDIYLDGYLFAVLIFSRYLEDYEVNIVRTWAAANYGSA